MEFRGVATSTVRNSQAYIHSEREEWLGLGKVRKGPD